MRIWLHRSVGDETGWNAWCLDLLGFATWASSEEAVLGRVLKKVEEHLGWLVSHGLPQATWSGGLEVVERVSGDEVLFSVDRMAVAAEKVDAAIKLLKASREDLLKTLEHVPEAALDWDPPYSSFAPWASWRTIRQVLAHIANTETHYYLSKIGCEPVGSPVHGDEDWREFLVRHRVETIDRLHELRATGDLRRVRGHPDDEWSVSKVLRRLVRHEILHRKSISRIVAEFQRRV